MTAHDPPPDRHRVPPGPVLAVCGWTNSGKTTVLSEVIPRLVADGLSVAAVKHDAHGIRVDPRGKDSDRLFGAGADVVLRGPGQSLVRSHEGADGDLFGALAGLLRRYDVVLVEGHKGTPLPKLWAASPDGTGPPPEVTDVRRVLPWGEGRADLLEKILREWLPEAWRQPPVLGGVLVGGASSRMGTPKAVLPWRDGTLLDAAVGALSPVAREVVLLGEGAVPEGAAPRRQVPDPPGLDGPLAGILGALRWAPDATWVVAACDQPLAETGAVEWLLDRRRPGVWAVLPRGEDGRVEPLLALYDARSRNLLEAMASRGQLGPRRLAEHPRVATPELPAEIRRAWISVNTPDEYERLRDSV